MGALWAFVGVAALVIVTPGPDTALTVRNALLGGRRAAIVGTGVALLYGYLYVLLMNEDYALLIGSVGLFAILATIMFATRRVDWYGAGVRSARQASEA